MLSLLSDGPIGLWRAFGESNFNRGSVTASLVAQTLTVESLMSSSYLQILQALFHACVILILCDNPLFSSYIEMKTQMDEQHQISKLKRCRTAEAQR